MKTIIEVGANNGDDTAKLLADDVIIYAFEPNPHMFKTLKNRFSQNERINIYDYAISDYCGKAQFNISHERDMGTSSLFDFHPNLKETPLWNFHDSHVFRNGFTEHCEVRVERLDNFCFQNNIHEIDYIHIDAQGSDFAVLKGLGWYITRVRAGRCECTYNIQLYKGAENTWTKIRTFLEEAGFVVTPTYTHQFGSEIDFAFERK